ncbi:BglG family transcription antiterminator [Heyndrickxia camelliae]|uniref:Ascorbate-specific PTS system EIIA component n=1 Tax=Heyndrickxia camelliae TaxID=1707093 RepID=A0A2N3LPG2_9BACI|nr:BglG family transcription antiterminator [Heyndrickxia camelliae]PKR86449.1 transcription antiterminator BglG [Heyndrickxia camelliae]
MQLDERSTILLKEILLMPGVRVSDLQKKLDISRYQVNYSLSKIDDWLSSNQMPQLQKGRQTGIFVDQVVQETFPQLVKEATTPHDFIISDIERQRLIILLLLIREEPFSLFHLSSALKVSRNTVLNDLKGVASIVHSSKLQVKYTRKDGYYIEGNELDKRKIIIKLVHQMLQTPNGKYWFMEILGISEEEIVGIRQRLEKIEKRLKVRFTDEKLEELPITLSFVIRRIKQRKTLGTYYHDLLNTEEYKAVDELLLDQDKFDEKELLFITLQLLTSNVSSVEEQVQKGISGLIDGIVKMLNSFEQLACIHFQDKDDLVNKIYLHLKPAYYRIKYKLTVENPLLDSLLEEHGELHHLIKKSISPLEEVFGLEIPENESAFLTMMIGSWLLRQGEEISRRKMAIVVCPNGNSVSKLLFESLRGLFPEIVFLDYTSLRDFITYPLEYDIVFSTTFLRTDKKLFLVKPLLSNDEKYRLKVRVHQELNGYNPTNINLDELINLIEQNTPIRDIAGLKKSLQEFFREKQSNIVIPEQGNLKPSLQEVMRETNILIGYKAKTWQEAVQIASLPLLNSMSITPNYVNTMIEMFEHQEPYIVIAPRVAIPHARPEDGVNHLSMSLLKLDEDVDFGGYPIRIFIVIAAIDRSTHLRALMQLNDLLSEESNIHKILEATLKQEILSLLEEYSK